MDSHGSWRLFQMSTKKNRNSQTSNSHSELKFYHSLQHPIVGGICSPIWRILQYVARQMTNNRLKSLCLSFHKISINNKALPRTNIETEIFRQTITISPRLWSWRLRGLEGEGGGGGGVIIPYIGHIGMCGPKGYGFCTVLIWTWV